MKKYKFLFLTLAALTLVTAAFYFFIGNKQADKNKISSFKSKTAEAKEIFVNHKDPKKTLASKKFAYASSVKPSAKVLAKAENVSSSVVSPQALATSTPSKTEDKPCQTGSFNEQFLCLLNQYRKDLGKSPVVWDSSLASVAKAYSDSMNTTGVFAHTSPDGSNLFDRCERLKTTCYGEILALNFGTARNLFTLWKNSPSHNAIMTGNYKSFGLGVTGRYATGLFR